MSQHRFLIRIWGFPQEKALKRKHQYWGHVCGWVIIFICNIRLTACDINLGKKNTCNTFLYRCFLLWFNCRYNLFCEEINMFFNCGNSACPLLQFDKQQVYVEKRGDDWDNGRENKISQQEITTIKIDLSKTMHQKNIVALLVVKNHYSRSPCSRLFGNQCEVQDEDFHNSMTSSGYRPPSVQMLDGPSPACFEDQTFFFLSSVIRYIIQECVDTCLQSSSKLWDTTVQFH